MKKVILLGAMAAALFMAEPALAQKSKITTAVLSYNNKDFAKAKEAINEAVNNEATKMDPKAWLYRGRIYMALSASDPAAFKEALNSYKKGVEFDEKNKFPELRDELRETAIALFNEGIKAYQEKDYAKALESFTDFNIAGDAMGESRKDLDKKLSDNKINPLDVKLYMASSAQMVNQPDKAKQFYKELADANYDEPLVYMNLADIYQAEKDTNAALTVIDKGLGVVKDKKGLFIDKLNIYINRGKKNEAIAIGQEALKLDPENVSLYIAMGNIYDNLKMGKEAEDMYNKAMEKDPESFNTNYSMGVSFFNQGADKYNLSINEKDMKKQIALEEEAKERFRKALPYLEKAHTKEPADKDVMSTLAEIYAKLGEYDKAKTFRDKIKNTK